MLKCSCLIQVSNVTFHYLPFAALAVFCDLSFFTSIFNYLPSLLLFWCWCSHLASSGCCSASSAFASSFQQAFSPLPSAALLMCINSFFQLTGLSATSAAVNKPGEQISFLFSVHSNNDSKQISRFTCQVHYFWQIIQCREWQYSKMTANVAKHSNQSQIFMDIFVVNNLAGWSVLFPRNICINLTFELWLSTANWLAHI